MKSNRGGRCPPHNTSSTMDRFYKFYDGVYWQVRHIGAGPHHWVVARFATPREAVDFCHDCNTGRIPEARLLWLEIKFTHDCEGDPRIIAEYEDGLLIVTEFRDLSQRLPLTKRGER